jgi:hypothetical protein
MVYLMDAPGMYAENVDGNVYRGRWNFLAYAELPDGTVVSPDYYFYVRVSCQRTSTGVQFVNDPNIPGDNQIGIGSTPTTWDLK